MKDAGDKSIMARRINSGENSDVISDNRSVWHRPEKYDVILADPPWDIQQKGTVRGAEGKYPLMTLDRIKGMGEAINAITADNAHLWLWVTNAVLVPYTQSILDAWGFTYRSPKTWVKRRIGLGNYLRNSTEQLIFATKGKAPVCFRSEPTDMFAPRMEHSRKPDEQYATIDRVSGGLGQGRKLELFARRKMAGWDVWGNEIDSDICLAEYGYPVPSDEKFLLTNSEEAHHE